MINKLIIKMIEYYSGDAKRIGHFIKVYQFAKTIGECEKIDAQTQEILEVACIVHDIGIKPAEQKYGRSDGKLQEKEGPAVAKRMLEDLGYDKRVIERVCYLVAHHHTYKDIDGNDYQILVEADFLVNLYEDNASKSAVMNAYKNIFKTETGKEICAKMFALF